MGIPAVNVFKNWAKNQPSHPDFKSFPDQMLRIDEPGNYRVVLWMNQDPGGNTYFRVGVERVESGMRYKSQREEGIDMLTATREKLEQEILEDEKKKKNWPHVG